MVGLAVDRPLKSNFFPGLLEGLLGSLGIAASGEDNPPTSSREGAGCAWSTAMHQAISWIEQKEVEVPGAVGLPPHLDLRYEEDFLKKQRHLIPPIFSDPLFIPKMAKAVFKVVKSPVALKALPPASSRKVPSTPHQPEDGGLKLRYQNRRSPPQVPHIPLNRSRSKSAGLPTLTRVRLTSPFQRRNRLVEVSKSNFPLAF